jgi:hypothetical protein
MQKLWTWGGIFFGYRDGDDLWTYAGRHVGHFEDEEIYGPGGRYLGEVMKDRLITCISKKSRHPHRFDPQADRTGIVPSTDLMGVLMHVGYEDFPRPEAF